MWGLLRRASSTCGAGRDTLDGYLHDAQNNDERRRYNAREQEYSPAAGQHLSEGEVEELPGRKRFRELMAKLAVKPAQLSYQLVLFVDGHAGHFAAVDTCESVGDPLYPNKRAVKSGIGHVPSPLSARVVKDELSIVLDEYFSS